MKLTGYPQNWGSDLKWRAGDPANGAVTGRTVLGDRTATDEKSMSI
jgi:hypothetical protein